MNNFDYQPQNDLSNDFNSFTQPSQVPSGHAKGYAITSLVLGIIAMIFACFFRIFWMLVVFPLLPATLFSLYLCYPISWGANTLAQIVMVLIINRRERRAERLNAENPQ